MVNVDVSPSVILGVGLIGAGVSLWQIRQARPWISKDYDVVVSCVSLLVGGILIFQGWRLDPLLLFGQLMTTGAAVSFAVEALRLRSEVYEREEKAALQDVFKRKAPGKPSAPGGASFQLPPADARRRQGGGWVVARGWGDEFGAPADVAQGSGYTFGEEQTQPSGAYTAGTQRQEEQQYGEQARYSQEYYSDDAAAPYDPPGYDEQYGSDSRQPYMQAEYYEPGMGQGYYGDVGGGGRVDELSFPPLGSDGEAPSDGPLSAAELDAEDWD